MAFNLAQLPGFTVAKYMYDSTNNVAGYVGVDSSGGMCVCLIAAPFKCTRADAVVAFRGTLPDSLDNWITDLNFSKVTPAFPDSCPGARSGLSALSREHS